MSFSYNPLELYYSYTVSFKTEDVERICKRDNITNYEFIKANVFDMLDYVESKTKILFSSSLFIRFDLNPHSWYIMNIGQDKERIYFYIFGLKLSVVAGFNQQIEYLKKSNNVNDFIKSFYYDRFNKDNKDNIIATYYQYRPEVFNDNYKIMDIFRHYSDITREEEEREKQIKIKRRRYYCLTELEKYKEIINLFETKRENEYKKTKDYILCQYIYNKYI